MSAVKSGSIAVVNRAESFGIDPAQDRPERALALGYAPAARRDSLRTLFALDATLARLARHTREPVAAQLRLAWWRDALGGLEAGAPGGQPLLAALRADVVPCGVTGADLTRVVDGWEALVAGDVPAYARDRGGALFAAGAWVLRAEDPWLGEAGEGWAFAELAVTSPDRAAAAQARAAAERLFDRRWPFASRAARPLAALAIAARMDLEGGTPGSPARVARLLRLRLFGR